MTADRVDVAETLVEEADALLPDLVFDKAGKLVSGKSSSSKPGKSKSKTKRAR